MSAGPSDGSGQWDVSRQDANFTSLHAWAWLSGFRHWSWEERGWWPETPNDRPAERTQTHGSLSITRPPPRMSERTRSASVTGRGAGRPACRQASSQQKLTATPAFTAPGTAALLSATFVLLRSPQGHLQCWGDTQFRRPPAHRAAPRPSAFSESRSLSPAAAMTAHSAHTLELMKDPLSGPVGSWQRCQGQ